MAVALTSSVNLVFGSEVMDPDTGIILNDEVSTIFSLTTIIYRLIMHPFPDGRFFDARRTQRIRSHAIAMSGLFLISSPRFHQHIFFSSDNYAAPLKRPLSSMAPVIIEYPDGSFYMAIGGSGGSRIFPSIFQVILNLDWGQDVSQAIEHGRFHDQLYPLQLDVEDNAPFELLESLRQRGHNVTSENSFFGRRSLTVINDSLSTQAPQCR